MIEIVKTETQAAANATTAAEDSEEEDIINWAKDQGYIK